MNPKYSTLFGLFDLFCQEPVQNPGHMAAGPSHCDSFMSAI